ncbi:MAG: alpha/beta hydrolase [Sedimentisphaerales bacterium]
MKLTIFGFCLCVIVSPMVFGADQNQPQQTNMNVNITVADNNSGIVKKYVDIGDAYIYYEIAGKGQPVILIHAYSVDCRMWDSQFTELAKHYQVIRYDLRGYGKTDKPIEGLKYSHAEDLHKLMWFLGIPKAHLVGLSMGASVAVDFLALYPKEVLSVTVAAGGIRNFSVPIDANAAEFIKKQGIEAYKKQWLENVLSICGPKKNKIQPKLQQMINDWSAWQVLHTELFQQINPPVDVQLKNKQPDVPVLILIGKNDSEKSIQSEENLAKILPKAHKKYLSATGHFSNMESPTEFNKALTEFLASAEKSKSK